LLEQGAGISSVDEFSAGAALGAGRLVRVLPRWRLPRGGVYALCQPGQHVPAKVRAFIDFYRGYLRSKQGRK
jgi:DNA-binding transcriptional LysR family regulator